VQYINLLSIFPLNQAFHKNIKHINLLKCILFCPGKDSIELYHHFKEASCYNKEHKQSVGRIETDMI
jgi:hypothetical protein